jgi:hypothetical protein
MPGTAPLPVKFNGTSSRIACALGAAASGGAYTFVSVVKVTAAAGGGVFHSMFGIETAAEATDFFFMLDDINKLYVQGPPSGRISLSTPVTGEWYLLAVSRPAGATQTVRWHLYRFSNTTWVHENNGTQSNTAQTDDHIAIANFGNGVHISDHDAAAWGLWTSALSDVTLESLPASFDAWAAASPTWWAIGNGTTALIDETGGTGDEQSRVGITASAEVSPIDWAGGGPVQRHLTTARSNLRSV